jgi:von Willebrand factor type A domain
MKKTFFILLAVLLVLVGCGGPAPSNSSGAPAPKPHQSPFEGTPGYILQFNKDNFKTGMNAVDDFGISVAIAMDVSGSMADPPESQPGGTPKFVQATRALNTVANYLEGLAQKQKNMKIRVCLLKFSGGVDVILPLTTLNAEGIAKLNAALNPENFRPDGSTAIGKAMETESEILAQSGTIFNSMIIVTDGENNRDPDPRDVMKALYGDRNNITTDDMKITTSSQLVSFVGFDVQSNQFDEFHNLGARITSADNQAEIESALKSFLEADITKLEAK